MSAPQTVVNVDCQTVKTNIVFLTVTKPGLTATQLYDRLLQVPVHVYVILNTVYPGFFSRVAFLFVSIIFCNLKCLLCQTVPDKISTF